MPKELRYFACEFGGCHRRPLKTRKRIIEHEAICWFNPANRTCATCGYSWYARAAVQGVLPDGSIVTEYRDYERDCLHPAGNKLPDNLEKAGPHIRPALNCGAWVNRDELDVEAREAQVRARFGGRVA